MFLELWQRNLLTNSNTVIEMGSQELHLSAARFDFLVRAAGIPEYDRKAFADLVHWPGEPRVSARNFYQLLGIKDYHCIDLNQVYGAIPHDLNQPLDDSSMHAQFDLVTDHGTNEHVFNIAETYRTMHRLCKPGGLMVVMQCMYGGNGYYNFDPSFFEGMASANDYRVHFSSFVVTVRKDYLSAEERRGLVPRWENHHRNEQFHIPLSNDLLNVVNWSKNSTELGICYVFQKQSDNDFQYAYQGDVQAQVQGNSGYELQFLADPPSRSYVPLHSSSTVGLQQEVLESISGKRLVRHLLRKYGLRFLKRG